MGHGGDVGDMKDHLVGLSDYVWHRTSNRLSELGDDEYLWEPVPGCWTIRESEDGRFYADGVQPAPQPPPFTTIAWRLAHLTACYGADRNGTFLHVELEPAVLAADGTRPGRRPTPSTCSPGPTPAGGPTSRRCRPAP